MKHITLEQLETLLGTVRNEMRVNKSWRMGQTFWNVLVANKLINPQMAGSGWDSFHKDTNIMNFMSDNLNDEAYERWQSTAEYSKLFDKWMETQAPARNTDEDGVSAFANAVPIVLTDGPVESDILNKTIQAIEDGNWIPTEKLQEFINYLMKDEQPIYDVQPPEGCETVKINDVNVTYPTNTLVSPSEDPCMTCKHACGMCEDHNRYEDKSHVTIGFQVPAKEVESLLSLVSRIVSMAKDNGAKNVNWSVNQY